MKLTPTDEKYLAWKKAKDAERDEAKQEVEEVNLVLSKDAAANRAKYPELAAVIDEVRKHFPGAKVTAIRPTQAKTEQD